MISGNSIQLDKLKSKAAEIRIDTIKSLHNAQSGHPGSSLGIADILTVLYFGGVLEKRPDDPRWEGRDYFLLSNGHAVPGLYATLAHAGYYPVDKLVGGLRKFGSPMHGHPKRGTFPGVEISSGSLGQGLSIGIGIAIALKLKRMQNRVFVMMSDGEQEEGSTWEAIMYASKHKLDNIVAIIDKNGNQINGTTGKIMPGLDPLSEKYKAFHWNVLEVNGHDYEQLINGFKKAKEARKPFALIANTISGKGLAYKEGDYHWHSGKITDKIYTKAIANLENKQE